MSEDVRQSISVVFSFRNEEPVLPELLRRLHAALGPLDLDYEFVFVDDASTDRSLEILESAAATDDRIRIVSMSNRFGLNPCFRAGMRYATGDAVITMDADLQDPPELIPELVAKWRAGADVVYATRTAREGEAAFKTWVTKQAYVFLRKIADTELPVEAGMYRLMSRRVVAELDRIDERDSYLRGLISWVGFEQQQVSYRRESRFAGRTHFPLWGRAPFREFVRAIVGFGSVLLDWILLGGIAVTLLAIATLCLLAVLALARGGMNSVDPVWFLAAVIALFAGVQLIATGIVAEFLGRTYSQVNRRPEYIVSRTSGFPGEPELSGDNPRKHASRIAALDSPDSSESFFPT